MNCLSLFLSSTAMASSTPLKDMEEKFFQCSICLEEFKEPKQLPCLHRYCRECLGAVIQNQVQLLECPLCKTKCDIPEEGVDGFKTDFHMKSMLQFIQLQKSLENEEIRDCVGCSKKLKVTAFCFKCHDFLCEECFQFHLTNKMVSDHQQHTLDLKHVETKNLTLDKLASLTEDPRCNDHPKNLAQLCCGSCGNLPICVACTFGKHKDHVLHEVTKLAKSERDKLLEKLFELNNFKEKLFEFPQKVENVHQLLKVNLYEEKKSLRFNYEQRYKKLKDEQKENDTYLGSKRKDVENKTELDIRQIRLEMEEELRQVREKYDIIVKDKEMTYQEVLVNNQEDHDLKDRKLEEELRLLETDSQNETTALEALGQQKEILIQEIGDYYKHVIKRYENFSASTSTILFSKNDWTDAQFLPDITAASHLLIDDVKKKFPELESLSELKFLRTHKVFANNTTITEDEESMVEIEGRKSKGYLLSNITKTGDGRILISGNSSSSQSHITIINRNGEKLRQKKFKKLKNVKDIPFRYCSFVPLYKVATVCNPTEIGIYDVRDGTYISKNLTEVVNILPEGTSVHCVATDIVKKHILVGSNTMHVYVFDYQLNYLHTLTLPDVIQSVGHVNVHNEHLLICDRNGRRAYVVTNDQLEVKVVHEMNKPTLDEGNWGPLSSCIDNDEFIYVLWSANVNGEWRRIIIQYGQNYRQLATKRLNDNNARCITTLETGEGEKLLVVTEDTGKLYTFGLVT